MRKILFLSLLASMSIAGFAFAGEPAASLPKTDSGDYLVGF